MNKLLHFHCWYVCSTVLFFFQFLFVWYNHQFNVKKEKGNKKVRYQRCSTWIATARDRKPLSANLSMMVWTFTAISFFSLHKFRICFFKENVWMYKFIISKARQSESTELIIFSSIDTCSGAPLLARYQLPSESIYVIAVRLSTGLNGRKCTSLMFARACSHNCTFSCLCKSVQQTKY